MGALTQSAEFPDYPFGYRKRADKLRKQIRDDFSKDNKRKRSLGFRLEYVKAELRKCKLKATSEFFAAEVHLIHRMFETCVESLPMTALQIYVLLVQNESDNELMTSLVLSMFSVGYTINRTLTPTSWLEVIQNIIAYTNDILFRTCSICMFLTAESGTTGWLFVFLNWFVCFGIVFCFAFFITERRELILGIPWGYTPELWDLIHNGEPSGDSGDQSMLYYAMMFFMQPSGDSEEIKDPQFTDKQGPCERADLIIRRRRKWVKRTNYFWEGLKVIQFVVTMLILSAVSLLGLLLLPLLYAMSASASIGKTISGREGINATASLGFILFFPIVLMVCYFVGVLVLLAVSIVSLSLVLSNMAVLVMAVGIGGNAQLFLLESLFRFCCSFAFGYIGVSNSKLSTPAKAFGFLVSAVIEIPCIYYRYSQMHTYEVYRSTEE